MVDGMGDISMYGLRKLREGLESCRAQPKLLQSLAGSALFPVDTATHPPTPAGILVLGNRKAWCSIVVC